jgi:hypothetical protein
MAQELEDSGVIANIVNPGLCHSALAREGDMFISTMKFFFARTTELGSRTLVVVAMAGPESCGKYIHDGKMDDRQLSPFVRSADGRKAAEKVWVELCTILESIHPGVTAVFEFS